MAAPTAESVAGKPRLEIDTSRQFISWLREQRMSLAFTTYQAGKLFFIGARTDNDKLWVHERSFERCMGLAVADNALYLPTSTSSGASTMCCRRAGTRPTAAIGSTCRR